MSKQYARTLFIFRRDLRLDDNIGFAAALMQSQTVIPCFIFDPRQIDPKQPYYSKQAVGFMLESLKDLEGQLTKKMGKLFTFGGRAEEVLAELIAQCHKAKLPIDAVFVNQDYTPFSKKRDAALERVCKKEHIAFCSFHDSLLHEPNAVLKKNGKPYTLFTPFYKTALQYPIRLPHNISFAKTGTLYTGKLPVKQFFLKHVSLSKSVVRGGSRAAHGLMRHVKDFISYQKTRDIPAIKTTLLSAHLKFGTVSVRHVYAQMALHLGALHPLTRQLFWRDFYTQVVWHFPHVLGHPYHKKFERLGWSSNKKLFERWCLGLTGVPLVDAGMRELNATGFMHNRVRMLTASFLIKDLHIDWREGERYFAQKLVDYDPAVNNGNWQWVASTGADSQPYFRIFNPWLQQKKFDRDCVYIKKWVPELANLSAREIHNWFKQATRARHAQLSYPAPLVDHAIEAQKTLAQYRRL